MTFTESKMRILGVDPGLNTTGYGVIEFEGNSVTLIEAGVVRSQRRDTLPIRLQALFEGIDDVIKSLNPTVMAMEQLYSHYERPRTAILMGHARGVLAFAAAHNGIPLYDYAATQVKRLMTGSGRAPKEQIQISVKNQLSLQEIPEPPDVADALAIALCHWFQLRTASLT